MSNITLPKIILHNSISIDGSLTNFEPHMGLHYQIAANYKPNAHLIGSKTIKTGIELYSDGIPSEENNDFRNFNTTATPLYLNNYDRGLGNFLLNIFYILFQLPKK